jgi:alanine racemase
MLTTVEIEKEAIFYNLNQFRKHIGKKTLLMPVIKSNAYGHGFTQIAEICLKHPAVNRICVVSMDEAIKVTNLGGDKPIQILSFFEEDIKKTLYLARRKAVFPIYTIEQAKFLNNIGKKINQKIKVHLKVDVGTSRVGVQVENLKKFYEEIRFLKNIYLEGLWSHFSSSEESKSITIEQLKKFKEADEILKKEGIDIPVKHIACTASTILYPETHFQAVRVGLGTYGLHPSQKTEKIINLEPALSLNTKIIQVKKIKKGTAVSYGRTWVAKKETIVATLPLGYFDGVDRNLSNKLRVLVGGMECPQIGRICMNLIMIDVSRLKNVKVGERVTIIGKQKNKMIHANDIAKLLSTINYEVVTKINPLIPRIVI